eukprot:CAMPEP_0118827420 /NCGR_PEP_ID=MMETSP1162-20130426/12625_1 /TAXON_ID=33656 /ORGANISM="Phaeocystis Sp, Strain CCMP2710" /LENGTH=164 /DNA_ID=CAMNT_0006758181 /DNA_START=556 /DNA_END=1048 /DNA_ORIENTATION=-
MEVQEEREHPRERRAHHRHVADGVSTRDGLKQVEVDRMPHDDLRRVRCVEGWAHAMRVAGVMRLHRLAVSRGSLEDDGAERGASRLGRVLDEQVLTVDAGHDELSRPKTSGRELMARSQGTRACRTVIGIPALFLLFPHQGAQAAGREAEFLSSAASNPRGVGV